MNSLIHFHLLLPTRIIFGWGERRQLGQLAATLGKRALIISGSRTLQNSPVWAEMMESLRAENIPFEQIATSQREPTIEDVDSAAESVRRLQLRPADFILAIGGGSALDLGKAVAAMATNGEGTSVREFLEGIGSGKTLENDPLPLLAVPTTSGTGSEATKNAVIACHEPPCKKSLRSEKLMPAVVLWDPELTVPLSAEQTTYSGMDAITQLLESYTSKRSQPVTDALCDMGLKLALGSLVRAVRIPDDQQAREQMASAAMLSGMALANSGLGMAHGVAAALGAVCDVPHGLACAVMLPITLKTNQAVIEHRMEQLTVVWKTLKHHQHPRPETAAISHIIDVIGGISRELKIPSRLREIGVLREQIPQLVSGSRGNSMNGNPRDLTDAELTSILEENW